MSVVSSKISQLQSELQNLQTRLHELQNLPYKPCPEVNVLQGSDGEPVGFITFDFNETVREGMVVLFPKSRKPNIGSVIYLTSYEVRDSKRNPGKKYIKAFQWISKEEYQQLKQRNHEIQRLNETIYDIEQELKLLQKIQEVSQATGIDEDLLYAAYKLDKKNQRDIAMQLFYHHLKPVAVLREYNDYWIVFEDKVMEVHIAGWYDTFEYSIHQVGKPIYGTPYFCLSETHELFTEDYIFDPFESEEFARAVAKKLNVPVWYTTPDSGYPGEISILLPKNSELLKKLKDTKETKMPAIWKKAVYLEILGIKESEVPEIAKSINGEKG